MLIVHHLMLIIKKLTFFVLGEGPNDGNNDSTGVEWKKLLLTLVKQIQNFTYVYITLVMRVNCM